MPSASFAVVMATWEPETVRNECFVQDQPPQLVERPEGECVIRNEGEVSAR